MSEQKKDWENEARHKCTAQQLARGRKPYEAPRLIVHGSVEELTKNQGVLLTDTLVTGSVVTTVTLLSP